MPRLSRRQKRRISKFGKWHIYELEKGIGWPFLPPDECFHGDMEAIAAAWEELREIVLRQWVAQHPMSRPWAWWHFDAPERRQRINGVHPHDNPERQRHCTQWEAEHPHVARQHAYKLWYGRPSCLCIRDDFDARYESQREYLTRLNLLTDHELAALKAASHHPKD